MRSGDGHFCTCGSRQPLRDAVTTARTSLQARSLCDPGPDSADILTAVSPSHTSQARALCDPGPGSADILTAVSRASLPNLGPPPANLTATGAGSSLHACGGTAITTMPPVLAS
eukprot:365891-Chlamydomonas_euryale.AAC.7